MMNAMTNRMVFHGFLKRFCAFQYALQWLKLFDKIRRILEMILTYLLPWNNSLYWFYASFIYVGTYLHFEILNRYLRHRCDVSTDDIDVSKATVFWSGLQFCRYVSIGFMTFHESIPISDIWRLKYCHRILRPGIHAASFTVLWTLARNQFCPLHYRTGDSFARGAERTKESRAALGRRLIETRLEFRHGQIK